MSVRRQMLSVARRILNPIGIDLVRYDPARSPGWRRQRFFEQLRVEVVLDVGANIGQYVCEIRRAGFGGQIASFEPLTGPFSQLQSAAALDSRWRCEQLALGDRDGEIEVNVSANSYSSSVLPMKTAHLESAPDSSYLGRERVALRRLDSLSLPTGKMFLKVDVQGYEREVLAGAAGLLPQIVGLELELSLTELYQGQALLPELTTLSQRLGFQLVSVETGFADPRTARVLQVDGIFVRDPIA